MQTEIKKVFNIMIAGILVISAACTNTAKFPVSQVFPEAEIKAKTRVDQDNNKVLVISARNLESPERVAPDTKEYVVWIETDEQGLRNIGKLESKEDNTATFRTETPYEFREIIITAESRANVSEPSGPEIARVEIPEYMVAPIPDPPPPGIFESDTGMFSPPGIPNPYDTLLMR